MNNKKLLQVMFLSFIAISAANAEYKMKSYTINNGASKIMTAGKYEMKSSIGQVDASHIMMKDNFQLNGGFWHQNTDLIFKNNFKQQ